MNNKVCFSLIIMILSIFILLIFTGCEKNNLSPTGNGSYDGLSPSVYSLDFGDIFTSFNLAIHNYHTNECDWRFEHDASWLRTFPEAGATGSSPDTVRLAVTREALSPGTYHTVLHLISDEYEEDVEINIVLKVPPSGVIQSCTSTDVRLNENQFIHFYDFVMPGPGKFGCSVRVDSCGSDYAAELLLMTNENYDLFFRDSHFNSWNTTFRSEGIYTIFSSYLDSGEVVCAVADNSILGNLTTDSDEENDSFIIDMLVYYYPDSE